mmetsp:Transcript_6182/g.7088  ORF Transcript_6182/g.7088 Transcript_6182/m.7088 type:complete len:451 (-) Transcript_6182:350-1702(-)
MTAIWEGGGPVTVLCRGGDDWKVVSTEGDGCGGWLVGLELAVSEGFEILRHLLAQIGGDNRRRGLHGTETEVVTRGGNGHAHEVTVDIHTTDNSRHDHREDHIVARCLGDLTNIQEVDPVLGTNGPVVVLAVTVDTGEGLLLEQSCKAVLGSSFLKDPHHLQVLIGLHCNCAKQRSKLVLVWSHLTVTGKERNAELEALLLNVLEALERTVATEHRCHIMIASLLTTSRKLAEDGTSSHLQIGTLEICVTGNEEELLFETDVDHKTAGLVSHKLEETSTLVRKRLDRTLQRGLFVQSVTSVTYEAGRNVHDVVPDVRRRLRVNSKVASRSVCSTNSSVGVGRAVRLALKQVITIELPEGSPILAETHHSKLDTASLSMPQGGTHGLEQMAEGRSTLGNCPFEHRVSDLISHGFVLDPSGSLIVCESKSTLRQILFRNSTSEPVLSVLRTF